MITLMMKNRPWSGQPRADFIRILSDFPPVFKAFRIDGRGLVEEPAASDYLETFKAWYHPATSWEMEEFRNLGGH
jgi:hypothetical protein